MATEKGYIGEENDARFDKLPRDEEDKPAGAFQPMGKPS